MTPSPTTENEFILDLPDARSRTLARALGARVPPKQARAFMTHEQAEHWRTLHSAGFHALRRHGAGVFRRDPRPLPVGLALQEARKGAV